MVIIRLMGGLGNQMQQYALYEKFKTLGIPVKLDISWFEDEALQKVVAAPRKLELNYFQNIAYEKATPQEIKALIGGDHLWGKMKRKLFPKTVRKLVESTMYDAQILQAKDVYLEGYWAAEKYYADILPVLRQKLIFPKPEGACLEMLQRMQEDSRYKVCMHIRRGDYLDAENQAMFGGICTDAYYEGAMHYLLEQKQNVHFYVFSDDPAYCKQQYGNPERFTLVDINHGQNSYFDILLMSCCNANITANSTFSFWGARLNRHPDKIMIRPSKHKNSQPFVPEEMKDLWPGWILVDPEGNVY